MTDQHLLRAITDNPDDDLPRLAYADYCEENGNPLRAEFIRLGFEVAATGLKECPSIKQAGTLMGKPVFTSWTRCGKCDFCRPMRRLQELLVARVPELWPASTFSAVGGSVEAAPEKPAGSPTPQCYFRKGFVEEIHLSLNAWLAHGSDGSIFASHVVKALPIRRVVASDKEPATFNVGVGVGGDDLTVHAWLPPFQASMVGVTIGTQARLPAEIYRLLKGFFDISGAPDCRGYAPGEAHAALSDVLLRVAHDPELLQQKAQPTNTAMGYPTMSRFSPIG